MAPAYSRARVAEGLWDVLCECVSVCLPVGYCALIVELLLMMAGMSSVTQAPVSDATQIIELP